MPSEKKRFAVLVEDLYEDQELWYPVRRLAEEEYVVTIVGPQKGVTYHSKHGYPASSDRAASDVSVDDFDGVIIPGGYAPDKMRRDEAMVALVRDTFQKNKLVGAICHGGWMLCSADVLRDRRATSFFAIRDDLTHAGAHWEDAAVVVDGNLITSRTPDDLPAFMRAIVAACQVDPNAARAAERARHCG